MYSRCSLLQMDRRNCAAKAEWATSPRTPPSHTGCRSIFEDFASLVARDPNELPERLPVPWMWNACA